MITIVFELLVSAYSDRGSRHAGENRDKALWNSHRIVAERLLPLSEDSNTNRSGIMVSMSTIRQECILYHRLSGVL